MKQVIIRATRSPLNPKQWSVELACGHEQWVTSTKKPVGSVECELHDTRTTVLYPVICPTSRGNPRIHLTHDSLDELVVHTLCGLTFGKKMSPLSSGVAAAWEDCKNCKASKYVIDLADFAYAHRVR